jgi:hypothetical protein
MQGLWRLLYNPSLRLLARCSANLQMDDEHPNAVAPQDTGCGLIERDRLASPKRRVCVAFEGVKKSASPPR